MAPSATSGNATVVPGDWLRQRRRPPARRPPSSSDTRAARVGGRGARLRRPARPVRQRRSSRGGQEAVDPVSHRRGRDRALCVGARRVAREGASERPAARGDADQRRRAHRRTTRSSTCRSHSWSSSPPPRRRTAGNQMKATLKLLGRQVFNADAVVEASPTRRRSDELRLQCRKVRRGGPDRLELRLADAPSNAEPIAEARIRTDQPLLTAPVIGGILLALYACSRSRRRTAGCPGARSAASAASSAPASSASFSRPRSRCSCGG